jgi:hypothetical protein
MHNRNLRELNVLITAVKGTVCKTVGLQGTCRWHALFYPFMRGFVDLGAERKSPYYCGLFARLDGQRKELIKFFLDSEIF